MICDLLGSLLFRFDLLPKLERRRAICRTRTESKMYLLRLQLFELDDLEWIPDSIRDLALDYLGFWEYASVCTNLCCPFYGR